MYPFLMFYLGEVVPVVPGIAQHIASLSNASSDTGAAALALTAGIRVNLYVITTDNRLLRTGYFTSSDSNYGSWEEVTTGADSFATVGTENLIVKMLDGSYKYYGLNTLPSGMGTVDANDTWTFPVTMADIQEIAIGNDHILVLMNDGTMWGGGTNGYGALGSSGAISTPTTIATGVTHVHSSGYCTGYYMKDSIVYASGYNAYGNLMNGGTTNRSSFAAVSVGGSTTNIASFIATHLGVKVITPSGDVYTCGGSQHNSGAASVTTPTLLVAGTGIPTSASGYALLPKNSPRSSFLVKSGDGLKYYASQGLGRGVGLASEVNGVFVEVFPGLDHSLTTETVEYGGGSVILNNGYLYTCGVDRPWKDPVAFTPAIIYPIQEPPFELES